MCAYPDLSSYGIDLPAGLDRMNGQLALYVQCLKCFPEDGEAPRLQAALARGDVRKAYACAHALKGLSAQLGLTRLANLCGGLCDLLQAPCGDALPRARALLPGLMLAYRQALRGIARLGEY